jgi:BirA family transcriptional regulator, biotin operon repressor / biotin---[acetyl-CoA-carboxylase] ligase
VNASTADTPVCAASPAAEAATAGRAPALAPMPVDTELVGRRILVYSQLDSTNNRALAASGDGVVIVAESQSAGRGRHGRCWHSAPGLGLWFSVGLDGVTPGLTFAAALALRDAVAPIAALAIKWPNDLLLNGKKVCGILVEHRQGRTALGIGLNVLHRPEELPADLDTAATSLALETGAPIDRAVVLQTILEQLDRRILHLRRGGLAAIREEWTGACGLLGTRVHAGAVRGCVQGINESGALYVVSDDRRAHWISTDVTLITRGP